MENTPQNRRLGVIRHPLAFEELKDRPLALESVYSIPLELLRVQRHQSFSQQLVGSKFGYSV